MPKRLCLVVSSRSVRRKPEKLGRRWWKVWNKVLPGDRCRQSGVLIDQVCQRHEWVVKTQRYYVHFLTKQILIPADSRSTFPWTKCEILIRYRNEENGTFVASSIIRLTEANQSADLLTKLRLNSGSEFGLHADCGDWRWLNGSRGRPSAKMDWITRIVCYCREQNH